ncbi:MAG: SCP-like extracellular [Gammaproteobacteria bacterium]|nr:SCP-like extracellular [Gammaproteobacteria bacterium]
MRRSLVLLSLVLAGCTGLPQRAPQQPEAGRAWLEAHNAYRAQHGAAPLVWSDKLAASAQRVADSCPTDHSSTPYGENMAWVSVPKTEAQIVGYWYAEEPLYAYDRAEFSAETGHFTQLVWRNTQALGCGQASGCNTRISNVWICHYDPPGNYRGQFGENVLPKGR